MIINTNIEALRSTNILRTNKNNLDKSVRNISSGHRINSAADDASGLSVSEYQRGRNVSLERAMKNANDGISFVQIAEGGLLEINNIAVRMKELSIQAASDTIGDVERSFINEEVVQLKTEIDRIAKSTNFGKIALLSGESGQFTAQIDVDNNPDSRFSWDRIAVDTISLGLEDINLGTRDGARKAIGDTTNAITTVSKLRSNLGAISNRFTSVVNNGAVTSENQKATISRIKDADIAKEATDLAKNTILTQSTISVLGQANTTNQAALKLFN